MIAGIYLGIVEREEHPFYHQSKDTSKDPLWLSVACIAWGIVGSLLWIFLTWFGIIFLAGRYFDLESVAFSVIGIGGFFWGLA
ncbi:MAG: hypothetical protein U0X87_11400 [Anaerolineales bacterium]